ncbi:MAG: aminotransferase class V-fold PLP-dependent enzyme [Cetobacterium sp.]
MINNKEYYFDNSATSHPKPETVYEAVDYAIKHLSGNPGRAGHHKAVEINRAIYNVRCKVAKFFNILNPLQVAFTANATESLNFAIKGLQLSPGDTIITSYFEHNSVLRPLFYLRDEKQINIKFFNTPEEIPSLIDSTTKAIVINHISNVNGNIQPVEFIGKIAKENNLLFILDVSQSAGFQPIDVQEMNIDILCFTGHKSLFAIQGIGGIYVKEGIELTPILEGGTGSYSKLERQPLIMPEALEAGTVNTPGIISLGAGIDFIEKIGLENIRKHEMELTKEFIEGIKNIPEVTIYSPYSYEVGPVVSINIKNIPSSDIGAILDEEFGIMVRASFHCAPLAHEQLKTDTFGTIRFSFGYFNTSEEIKYAIEAIKIISKNI